MVVSFLSFSVANATIPVLGMICLKFGCIHLLLGGSDTRF